MIMHKIVTSPLGVLTLVSSEGALSAVRLGPPPAPAGAGTPYGIAVEDGFEDVERQLSEYFEGRRCCFTVATSPEGTEFQQKVWEQVAGIGYGRTASYKQLAVLLGDAAKARSVGAALARNPLNLVVPTHRVVGSRGALTGYSGGVDAKRYLLELEQAPQTEHLRRSCGQAVTASAETSRSA
ncbi:MULTISPECIES: methylated-DNA--[protein]-cysteine S-methyltransferase [unclassified Arthrobacter]|uniref:methylated-DNA--[protein]-cysteine S-methyltransferase n=1 Tax=unclassified Arthrobacter TaxID=235627 RepID=UPI001E39FA41|nr:MULTISPECIES: methylated-DNA--[protein]-cysteine S-methyltransferase [unclassified Arthrobacter]MCC9145709.1 methylated-DNA--[protein]-cysteine S-methyltransferase [Arthrobacter sp. zg-Y919]MDK1276938.1 methylated-DNA--[protein]-cysteine S-methyltransferase [Arthrobacter sp. zg.Y919]WIB04131.1 methylated-DNA--[protein]-cysteine S-methyltransferase [Arthrobacter sp. zg-Y919]